MALTREQRQLTINHLVANCDCWKQPGDREVLESLPDEKLQQLKDHADKEAQAVAVANTAVTGFADGQGNAYRINPETGKWEHKVVANAPPKKAKAADPDDDDDDEEEEEEDKEVAYREKTNKKRMAGNAEPPEQPRLRTEEDWMKAAPPEMQKKWGYLQQIEQQEKDKVIDQLLVNVDPASKRAHYDRLVRRGLDELKYDLSLMPKTPPLEDLERATGQATANRRQSRQAPARDEDMLGMPTINWQEMGSEGKGQESARQEAPADDGPSLVEVTEEEWLRSAPAHLRSAVTNAVAIEAREKRKLIDELVGNIADEDTEKRLRARLSAKSLDELDDMVKLYNTRKDSRPNYFGSSAAPPVPTRTNNVNEDVLPLPTIDWGELSRQA